MSLITYEAIREVQRAEQSEKLQKLPAGFFEAVKNWIEYKKNKGDELSLREIESAKKLLEDIINRRQRKLLIYAIGTVRGDLPPEDLDEDEKEFFERAVQLVREFRSRMSDKILTDDGLVQKRLSEVSKILNELNEKNASVEETANKETARVEKSELRQNEAKPIDGVSEKKEEKLLLGPGHSAIEEKPRKGIKLLVDLPKFVDSDLNSYGPFKAGEIIHVPDNVKELLIKKKAAEEI